MKPVHFVLGAALILPCLGALGGGGEHDGAPPRATICAAMGDLGYKQACLQGLVPLKVSEVHLQVLKLSAARVYAHVSIPQLRMMFVRQGGEWMPIIAGDWATEHWEEAVTRSVEQGVKRIIEHPDLAARDFSQVFVDVDSVNLLDSEASIPAPDTSAEAWFRDRRSDKSLSNHKRAALNRRLRKVRPPRIRRTGTKTYWQFYTWRTFDGIVEEWKIRLLPSVAVETRMLASEVGAWVPRSDW